MREAERAIGGRYREEGGQDSNGKFSGWEQQRQSMIGSQDLETRAESGGQGCRESKTGQQGFVAGRMGGLPSLGHCRSMNDNVKVYKDLYYGLH